MLAILLIIAAFLFTNHNVTSKTISKPNTNSATTEISPPTPVFPGLNIQTEKKETDDYRIITKKPVTDSKNLNSEINQAIGNWMDEIQNHFITKTTKANINAANQGNPTNKKAHLTLTTQVQTIADDLYTLEIRAKETGTGKNTLAKTLTVMVDLKEEQLLKPTDIFQNDLQTLENVRDTIKTEIANHPAVKNHLNQSDSIQKEYLIVEENQQNNLAHPDNWQWLINKEEFILYIGQPTMNKIVIPLDLLKDYLNIEFAERIGITLPESKTLDPNGKYVALTFDDGPHPEVTPHILDTLQAENIKATFYMLGASVEEQPETALKVAKAGHELANHTFTHADLSKSSLSEIHSELERSNNLIEAVTGQKPQSFRPPYGARNEQVDQIANDLGLAMVLWTVDSLDWKSLDADLVYQKTMSEIKPNSIVLMHDIHPSTAEALPRVIKGLKNQGYEFLSVTELLEHLALENYHFEDSYQ